MVYRVLMAVVYIAVALLLIRGYAHGEYMHVVVTGYTANDPRQGTGSRTATGRHAKHPGVAVDPRVIPLGSHVRIGRWWYLADDTGKEIKGRRIDLRFTSRGDALRWGRKRLVVEYGKTPRNYQKKIRVRKFQNRHKWEETTLWMFWNWRCFPDWDSYLDWKETHRTEADFYCPEPYVHSRIILRPARTTDLLWSY